MSRPNFEKPLTLLGFIPLICLLPDLSLKMMIIYRNRGQSIQTSIEQGERVLQMSGEKNP